MSDPDSPVLGIAIASLILFGFIHLVQRTGPIRGQSGGPSVLMRACGLLAGVAGAILVVMEYGGNPYPTAVMPYCVLFVVMLLAYGCFGLPRPRAPSPADAHAEQPGISENAIVELGAQRHPSRNVVFCCAILAGVVVTVLIAYTSQLHVNSRRLQAQAAYPEHATVGQEFKVTVDLMNPGEREVPVQGICLARSGQSEQDSILAGARIKRIDPLLESDDAETSPCGRISGYTVRARETKRLTFYFEGLRPGDFSTDIFFYLEDSTIAVSDLVITLAPYAAQEQYPQSSAEDGADQAAVFHTIR